MRQPLTEPLVVIARRVVQVFQTRMRAKPEIPPEIDEHRDSWWRREGARQVATALDAERFIEQVGFAACLTDVRRPGPSLYVAVCGRRDAVMPRNVQTDEEASLTWRLKDDLIKRGKVYYAKLAVGMRVPSCA
jgi:hypothetical protein